MRILALDLSLTATGWAGPTLADYGTLSPPRDVLPARHGGHRMPRLDWIRQQVFDRAARPERAVVAVEAYAFARAHRIAEMGELGGIVRHDLWAGGIQYYEIAPATLKRYATGRGNAKKEEVLAAAIRRLGYAGHDPNEADALWLLALMLDLHEQPNAVKVPENHRAALVKLTGAA